MPQEGVRGLQRVTKLTSSSTGECNTRANARKVFAYRFFELLQSYVVADHLAGQCEHGDGEAMARRAPCGRLEPLEGENHKVQLDVVKGVGNEIQSLTMDPDDIGGRSGQAKIWVTKLAYRRVWASSSAVVIVVVVAGRVSAEQDLDKN